MSKFVNGACMLITIVCIAIVGFFCGPKLFGTHAGDAWSTVWYQDFSDPNGSGVDVSYWKYVTGQSLYNNEVEVMTDSAKNVYLDSGGDLNITALRQGGSWTSGRIQTIRYFDAPTGSELKVIASIKQPAPVNGIGYWPAFWLRGQGTWPQHGEIDIMEDVNALSENAGAMHCGNLASLNADGTFGPCHEHAGISSGMQPCEGCQSGYHTYSVIIDRRVQSDEHISWYLDGREYFNVNERRVGARAWNDALDNGFSIIFDLAIGGSYPNERCGCTTPTAQTSSSGTLSIRYVGV